MRASQTPAGLASSYELGCTCFRAVSAKGRKPAPVTQPAQPQAPGQGGLPAPCQSPLAHLRRPEFFQRNGLMMLDNQAQPSSTRSREVSPWAWGQISPFPVAAMPGKKTLRRPHQGLEAVLTQPPTASECDLGRVGGGGHVALGSPHLGGGWGACGDPAQAGSGGKVSVPGLGTGQGARSQAFVSKAASRLWVPWRGDLSGEPQAGHQTKGW